MNNSEHAPVLILSSSGGHFGGGGGRGGSWPQNILEDNSLLFKNNENV